MDFCGLHLTASGIVFLSSRLLCAFTSVESSLSCAGMDRAKMKRLLHEAFAHLDPEASCEKINKRLDLFGRC